MKKVFFLIGILFASIGLWAQETKLSIVNYTIGDTNIMNEFNGAVIKWNNKKVVKTDIYGDKYNETVYELEIKLHNANTKSTETIKLAEGTYAGTYGIYFSNVVFPRSPEKKFRSEYYEDHEDNSISIYLYDINSESRAPYVILELREG